MVRHRQQVHNQQSDYRHIRCTVSASVITFFQLSESCAACIAADPAPSARFLLLVADRLAATPSTFCTSYPEHPAFSPQLTRRFENSAPVTHANRTHRSPWLNECLPLVDSTRGDQQLRLLCRRAVPIQLPASSRWRPSTSWPPSASPCGPSFNTARSMHAAACTPVSRRLTVGPFHPSKSRCVSGSTPRACFSSLPLVQLASRPHD